ncbi:alcohol dehydrogenase [Alicyclobacillus hesperidum subsp. aegles]|uniref:zinc-binding alcohol dehydrogenase family protein n=1 Tax=Alicyclobacillus hesperidum TaxID=89784 RepID=UPI00222C51A2|nr:zinc-binding alcohol dehydrogenase family protein [Alicyclobacillus hesperidum]GLG02808.1 alcohol dehydrogenase [Alicyclobacillus hesperidum subsp. aegles]
MLAVSCEKPGNLKILNKEKPICRDGEILVRVRRVGICGTDVHAYRGEQPFFQYPRIFGHEIAGVVEEVRDPQSHLIPGDTVALIPYVSCGHCNACRRGKENCCKNMVVLGVHADGGMQEWITVKGRQLIKCDNLTLEQAVIMEPLSIGAHAVQRAAVSRHDTVLVIGTGPIGMAVAAFSRLAGARVLLMDSIWTRMSICGEWAMIDSSNFIPAGIEAIRRVEQITNGDMPDVVFDATGNTASMERAIDYVAHGGRLVLVGVVSDSLTYKDSEMHKREISLLTSRNALRSDFVHVMEVLGGQELGVEGYITHQASLADINLVWKAWFQEASGIVKGILLV